MAELGVHTGRKRYLEAGARHLDWVLRHYVVKDSWFELCGFDTEEHSDSRATTHTIAYTIFGALYMSQLLARTDGIEAARNAALAALRCAESEGRVPGALNSNWRYAADYSCLTGNAQFALILDEVKRAQVMHLRNPGLQGGIAGSAPIWGDYLHFALPNWAVKFFIDALLMKKEVMSNLQLRDGR